MMHSILPALNLTVQVEWVQLAPLLVVMGTAALSVLVEALPSQRVRHAVNGTLMVSALLVALILVAWRWVVVTTGDLSSSFGGHTLAEDKVTLTFQGILLLVALLAALVVLDRSSGEDGSFTPQAADTPASAQESNALRVRYQRTEMYTLLLFSVGGMMAFISSNNLLMMFVALEIMSLPLYVMSAMGRNRRLLSQEAGFKYFLQGAYASAFFLMGIALLYGFGGTLSIRQLSQAMVMNPGLDWMLLAGFAMLLVGLYFKVGAVPFHAWTPDVYQGAPSPISGFMAAGVKVAAFGILTRLTVWIAPLLHWDLIIFMWVIIIATITVGTYLGLVQSDIKRMLAYSSIAHAGFILIALSGASEATVSAVQFYVLAYGVSTIGAFALISVVRDTDAEGTVRGETSDMRSWDGLGHRHPVLAAAMTIFLLSFAGIPLTGGFIGKFEVFQAGMQIGAGALVFIGLLASIVTAFYYFRVIQRMFFTPVGSATASVPAGSTLTKTVVVLCALATVILGTVAQPVFGLLG